MKKYNAADVCIRILIFSIIASATSREIHEDMTSAEVAQTFDVTENDILPEYDLVPIHYSHVNKRAINGQVSIRMKPFGRDISLWLEPADGILFSDETPIYSVARFRQGLKYTKFKDAMKRISALIYADRSTQSTLAVSRGNNFGKRMVGHIGSENLVIRPVPKRFVHDIRRYRRSINEIPESEKNNFHYHIVYKNPMNNSLEQFKSSTRLKRANQNTVYPEILVIVDNNLYELFEKNFSQMVLYLMAFWNGVDMMYRSLENPKFRLNIAAIILVENNPALDYVSLNRVESNKLAVFDALNASRYWLYENLPKSIRNDNYDIAVTMTTLNFCERIPNQNQCKLTALGLTYIGSACTVDDYFHVLSKTIMVHDNGGFNGIHTAGHELAHSFGANHDGEKNNIRCSAKIGNIMKAQTSFTENLADWSECTLTNFETFLNNKGKCLYNKPKYSGNVARLLPGKMKDAHKQCYALEGTKAYKLDKTICHELNCYKGDGSRRVSAKGAAVDGTPCGYKRMCLHGKCILESLVT